MALIRKPQLVTQPTPWSCTHACLSMVSGVPVQDIIDEFGEGGMTYKDELKWLVRHDILPAPCLNVGNLLHPFPMHGVYIISAPSLNMPGKEHSLVVVVGKGYQVLDPNTGRDGADIYFPDSMSGGEPVLNGYSGVFKLVDCSKEAG